MGVLRRLLLVGLLLGVVAAMAPSALGQEGTTRKVKTKATPAYPELARRLQISGVVKLQITVAANGSVKDVKVIGGHPILVSSATDAIKKWRYEPAKEATSDIVEFHFDP
jgi:TonB family protein